MRSSIWDERLDNSAELDAVLMGSACMFEPRCANSANIHYVPGYDAAVISRVDLRSSDADAHALVDLPQGESAAIAESASEVLALVRQQGDAALRELTERFDGVNIDEFRVPAPEVSAALASIDPELRTALERAAARIREYHEQQGAVPTAVGIDRDGISVTEMVVPVNRVGCYVPGGLAVYPSSVLMTVIPARVAGVPEVVLCVPPGSDGRVPAVTLAAAAIAGVDEIYRVGGSQAIAAMAYGTESIAAVDVIVGPGNAYVSAAKREVAGAGIVGIESPAGPSELVVVADADAPADWIAGDLVAQAEHGPGGRAILVTWDAALADAVDRELTKQVENASRMSEIASTLETGGLSLLVRDEEQAMAVVNQLAPEHLELVVNDPETLVGKVRNAGAVFLGAQTPTALGDYVAGANHVLPTGRSARFASALRVDNFRKHIHIVRATDGGVRELGAVGAVIARAEGLDAHALSLEMRSVGRPEGKV